MQVNSEATQTPHAATEFGIVQSEAFVVVTSRCGVTVRFDGAAALAEVVTPRRLYGSALTGLCGDCNGQRADDLLVGGEPLKSLPGKKKDAVRAFARQYLLVGQGAESDAQ